MTKILGHEAQHVEIEVLEPIGLQHPLLVRGIARIRTQALGHKILGHEAWRSLQKSESWNPSVSSFLFLFLVSGASTKASTTGITVAWAAQGKKL
ncbi:hypothetical protein BHM03_00049699 [Ensete ventricosum]|nr:hypothetical protein BHM03_00049699 [Ensete ventricosum]